MKPIEELKQELDEAYNIYLVNCSLGKDSLAIYETSRSNLTNSIDNCLYLDDIYNNSRANYKNYIDDLELKYSKAYKNFIANKQ